MGFGFLGQYCSIKTLENKERAEVKHGVASFF